MKKFISLLLAMTMVFSVCSPAFAVDVKSASAAELQEITVDYNNESITIRYQADDENKVTYAEIGTDIMQVEGNQVFLNGELIATITSEVIYEDSDAVEPRTSWIYTDDCPYGTFSDYTTKWKTVNRNITFEEVVAEASVEIIFAVLFAMVDFESSAVGRNVFWAIAREIKEAMEEYATATKVYAKEVIYSHKTVPSSFHQNNFYFYADSGHSDYIDYALAYSTWA